ncbi:MAG TPA: DUF4233 domain-containing protein [Mycobacterium sp.]
MTERPDNGDGPANPPPSDPWKSFRGVMAATLLLEAIVVLLAIPVVGAVGGGLNPVSLGYLIGLTVLLVLLGGLQSRPGAIWVNLGVQVIVLGGFAIYPGIGFIGVLFAGLWAMIAYLRAEVRRRQDHGQSPPG